MRRRGAETKEIMSDPRYKSKLVGHFINILMLKGKKSIAEKIVYGAFDILREKTGEQDAMKVFQKAIDNARPLLELKSRRVGGATYQVPVEVSSERGTSITLRWIRNFARQKKGKPMQERLADELLEAYKGTGSAIKKKEDTHKMAEANRAFSHYRW